MSVKVLQIPGKTNPVGIAQKIDGCQYFTWGEALHELTRTPANYQVTVNIIAMAKALDVVRIKTGAAIVVQSWYRDPETNRRVGGVDNSEHLLGNAVDWHPVGVPIERVREYLIRNWKGGLGDYWDWFHTDLGTYARW